MDTISKGLGGAVHVFPTLANKESQAFWRLIGATDSDIQALATLGKIASILSVVAAGTGAGIAIGVLLGLINAGPDPIAQKLDEIEKTLLDIAGNEDLIARHKNMADFRNIGQSMSTANRLAKVWADNLDNGLASQLQDQQLAAVQEAFGRLSTILDPEAAQMLFLPGNYTVWGRDTRKYFFPVDLNPKNAILADVPRPNTARFDHRFLVPNILYGVATYAALSRAYLPEFRSLGVFASDFRTLATQVSTFLDILKSRCLCRYLYTPADMADAAAWVLDKNHPPFGGNPLDHLGYIVGAYDVCTDTDATLHNPVSGPYSDVDPYAVLPPEFSAGNLTFRWRPPAQTQVDVFGGGGTADETRILRILNRLECVDKANALSEAALFALFMRSGALALAQQAGFLASLATEPATSETVSGKCESGVIVRTIYDVVAKTEDIPYAGVISAKAELREQDYYAQFDIELQSTLGQREALNYRLVARALRLDFAYADYFAYSYQIDSDNPPFLKLVTQQDAQTEISHSVLWEGAAD